MNDVETVFDAIQTLHGQDESSRAKASVWLTEFQKSVHAWQICDRIIHERRSITSMYFASQTMRQKILFDFKELPVDSYGSLRDSLITHLLKVNCTDSKESVIMTQLCLALVDLYLQVPNWPNFIAELLSKFSNNQNDRTLILLCLLKVCPEEARNQQVRVGQNRRNEVEAELAIVTSEVLNFLAHLCHTYQKNEDIIRRSILCLSSWLQNPQVPTNQLADNPILQSTLTVLQNPNATEFEVLDAASECISSALYRVEDVDANQAFAKVLQAGVFKMIDAYKRAEEAEDYNKMQHYGRVFVEAGETFLECVVRCPGPCGLGDLRTFDLMILLVESNDQSLLDMTFNVWYRLSEYLFQGIDDDDVLSVFKPYVKRYLQALLKHCRYEAETTELPDPNDDFGELRTKISDSIKDVLFIVGVEECMHIVSEYYANVQKVWYEIEAAVFFFSSIVHNIRPSEETFVPSMLDIVVKTQDDAHPALLQTMIDLLENAEEWIRAHPACLDAVMEWLIRRLRDQRFAVQAAKTVSTICEKNYSVLSKYFQPLITMITEYETAIEKGAVLETASEALLQACSCLINDLPFEELSPKFEILIRRQNENLHRLCATSNHKQPTQFRKRDSRTDQSWTSLASNPITWLDRISCVYRYVKPWGDQEAVKASGGHVADTVMHLVEETWKVLLLAMKTFMRDVCVIEHSCRAVRFVIRSLGLRSAPIVKELVHTMVEIYQNHQHSCFLYLGSILIDEYGGMETFQQELLDMMQLLASYSFKILQNEHGFRNNPDTVDDLFRMGIRFLQRAPIVFICAPICDLMFQCGIKGMQVDHQDANRSVTLFFDEVVNFITDNQKRQINTQGMQAGVALYLRYGAQLTSSALSGTLFYVSGGLKKDLCEVMDGVRRVNEEAFGDYLRQAIELLPHDTVCSATQEQLREFHAKVLKTRSRRELASQVRDLCAYYR